MSRTPGHTRATRRAWAKLRNTADGYLEADGDLDAAEQVVAANDIIAAAEAVRAAAVAECREDQHMSWTEIAKLLGVTKQAATKRYGKADR